MDTALSDFGADAGSSHPGMRHACVRTPIHRSLCFGSLGLVLLATAARAFEPRPLPGRVVLTLRAPLAEPRTLGTRELDDLHARFAVSRFAPLFDPVSIGDTAAHARLASYYVVDFPAELDLETVRAAYARLENVERVEFDWMLPLLFEPDDAGAQWHHESASGMDAHLTGGWNHSQGDTSVVLAIADSGVDWMHPDLGGSGPGGTGGNIWTNWVEFHGTPGRDDDGNGKIDDVRGWDFVQILTGAWPGEDSLGADADPRDWNGHGTHVAGIAGARTNNGLGVAGVGFDCRIMPLRIGGSVRDEETGDEQGVVLMSHAAQAILYAANKHAAAINCSWGSVFWAPLRDAVDVAVAQGMVVVVAAGNDAGDAPSYLSQRGDCFDVAATTAGDHKAGFSNYGAWVDVAAPGVDIYSTYYDHVTGQHGYRTLQGTSMAAPIVTGLVGLLKSAYPNLPGAWIQHLIELGADDIDERNPEHAGLLGSGRVNALRIFRDRFLTVPDDYPTLAKAMAASAAGDTVAARAGATLSGPLYVQHRDRQLLGGWNADWSARDPSTPSILDGLGRGPTLEFAPGLDSTTVVDGFLVRGGVARLLTDPAGFFGGGVLCIDASPRLQDCGFEASRAGDDQSGGGGGGGYFRRSRARLLRCAFRLNHASRGAGLYAEQSHLELEDCVVQGNQAPLMSGTLGGGIYVDGGSLRLVGSHVVGNGPVEEGGGAWTRSAILVFRDVEFAANLARNGGGIAATQGSTLDLRASVMRSNEATELGGAVYANAAPGAVANVTFVANRGIGGAIFAHGAAWGLHSSLIVDHPDLAVFFFGGAADLDYNMFWHNTGGDVQGGSLGPEDLVADPLFVDLVHGDLALGLHSPALDSGDPEPEWDDPDGSRNDRGADGGPWAVRSIPAPPARVFASRIGVHTTIAWPDPTGLAHAIYRGADSTFVPGNESYVGSASVGQSQFVDTDAPSAVWYRVAAFDARGASSGFSPEARAETVTLSLARAPNLEPRDQLPSREAGPVAIALQPLRSASAGFGFRLDLPAAAQVHLEVFDVRGRRIRELWNAPLPGGHAEFNWDGRDHAGRVAGVGVYIVSARSAIGSVRHKLVWSQ